MTQTPVQSTTRQIARDAVNSPHYEPFDGFDAVLDGDPSARVAWLRTSGTGEGRLYAGMFAVAPSTFRYTFAADETFVVLDGEVEIAVDHGDTVRLGLGDTVSFPGGVRSTWRVISPLRKFFVISG